MTLPSTVHPAHALWADPERGAVARIAHALARTGVHPARCVVIVPSAQLLGVAGAMWARHTGAGFAPRFETTRSWARSAGGFVPAPHDLVFDTGRDLIAAQALLAQTSFGADRQLLAGRLVELAGQLAPLAAAQLPDARAAWMVELQAALRIEGDAEWFKTEGALNAIALAWAANSAYATDVLLRGPAATQVDLLVVIEGLQPDPLADALCDLWGDSALRLAFPETTTERPPALVHAASDPEDEAELAAACVLRRLEEGHASVALIALDRLLTRRISAQLEAQGVAVHDETGWKLSTTRSAATLMSALRASARTASSDQVLDWLKGTDLGGTVELDALETRLRREGLREWQRWSRFIAATASQPEDEALRSLTQNVEDRRARLSRARPLDDWLRSLRALMEETGVWEKLAGDAAGASVVTALWLDAGDSVDTVDASKAAGVDPGPGHAATVAATGLSGGRFTLAEFTLWVRDVLEAGSFVPPAGGAASHVIVLPPPQLLGRAFDAVVVPGCDERRLPASPEPPGAWTAAQRLALGLPSRESLEAAQRAAWAIVLQQPRCELLWRTADASGEPVRPSPLVQALRLEGGTAPGVDARRRERIALRRTLRPLPRGDALPLKTISATVYEDLRRCPYRFFALRQLGLRASDEIDSQVDKRDFGNWLHAVLGHFHAALKDEPKAGRATRLSLMETAATRATREFALGEAEFLPFAAAWPAVRDGYLDWLGNHEADGAEFVDAEPWLSQPLGDLRLVGRLDRIDRMPDGRAFVIDYKTEAVKKTEDRVKDPAEDTQLAFYAALMADDTLRAAYVNVGEKASGTKTVEQPEVVAARDALVTGLMDDFARIADGAALPPLGEGAVCDHCEARGLCRRDFWADDEVAVPDAGDAAARALTDAIHVGGGTEPWVAGELPVALSPAYEHNGQPVAREAFYRIACDPRRNVAVEACAGAGKTWMLVSRIIRALLEEGEDACAPHEILAITFTRKAAGEMGARLDQWLAQFAAQPHEALVDELVVRGMTPAAARLAAPRLQGLYRRLLDGGRPVQFRTFHAWFAGLVRNAPLAALAALGLPANHELLEDDAEARAQAWRPFLEAVAADAQALEDYQALVATHGRSQTAKALDEALTRRVEFGLSDPATAVEPFGALFPALDGLREPVDALSAEPVRARWLARAAALGREANKTPQKAAEAIVEVFGDGVPAIDEGARVLARLRKAFFVAAEDRLTNHLRKYEAAQEAEQELQLLCAAQAQHAAWLHQQRMTRLARLLIAAFSQVKRVHGWIDMNDIEQAAQMLLGRSALSGWVQERLDARVAHLLIDEFQDTNPLQWQALHSWLSAYSGAGARAPSVFIVGDPKQSIYRFRRAEPQVFVAAKDFVRAGLGGELLTCDHTHRNARRVVGLVNHAMRSAQELGQFDGFRDHSTERHDEGEVHKLPPIDRDAVARPAARGAADEADPGELRWRDSLVTPRVLPETRLLQLECEQAARWVAERIADGVAPKEIMVLARRRSRLAAMQEALRSRHIATQQPEKNDLNDAPEVQDVIALVDALVSPAHDLSLARALKSPLFGIGDDALASLALRQRAQPESSWFSLLKGDAPPGSSSLPAQAGADGDDGGALAAPPPSPPHEPLPDALAQALPVLLRWQVWLATLPPHDALSAIYEDGDVLARFGAAVSATLRTGVLANLRGLLGAALEIEGARFVTPYAFVRSLRAGGVRAPSSGASDAVRLLTVHGAKGLEADHVLMLDCDAAAPRAQTMGVLIEWKGDQERPSRFVFMASEKTPPACAQTLLQDEQAARLREELNGLYVATTRARQRLVLSSVRPARATEGSWWARLEAHCEPVSAQEPSAGLATARAGADAGGDGDAESFILSRAPRVVLAKGTGMRAGDTQGSSAADLPISDAAADATVVAASDAAASALGQAMHRLLEWTVPGVPLTPLQVRAAAREFALDAAAAHRAATLAARIRAGAGAWAWEAEGLDWQGNEVTLVHSGRVLRIDRLVRRRDTGAWWVFDYKSAARPEGDAALTVQLRRYRAAVREAHPGDIVHAAFLTGQGELVILE